MTYKECKWKAKKNDFQDSKGGEVISGVKVKEQSVFARQCNENSSEVPKTVLRSVAYVIQIYTSFFVE